MTAVQNLFREVNEQSNPQKAKILMGFFKTGKGQYGFGDEFAGITVPQSRKIALNYQNLPLLEISKLLKSALHEIRLIALLILVNKFQNTYDREKIEIFKFYLKNTKFINNWDLVDLSAHKIVGDYLLNKDWSILKKMAKSKKLW